MILSDATIRSYISDGTIGVEPEPKPTQYQPASLDVRLGREIYDTTTDTFISGRLEFKPGIPYIAHTVDKIDLPDWIAAMLTGRSSVGREGLIVHKTAGWIDPGFTGQLTLEVYNFGDESVHLDPGDRVAQLVFFRTDRPTSGYDGVYQEQTGITKSVRREP